MSSSRTYSGCNNHDSSTNNNHSNNSHSNNNHSNNNNTNITLNIKIYGNNPDAITESIRQVMRIERSQHTRKRRADTQQTEQNDVQQPQRKRRKTNVAPMQSILYPTPHETHTEPSRHIKPSQIARSISYSESDTDNSSNDSDTDSDMDNDTDSDTDSKTVTNDAKTKSKTTNDMDKNKQVQYPKSIKFGSDGGRIPFNKLKNNEIESLKKEIKLYENQSDILEYMREHMVHKNDRNGELKRLRKEIKEIQSGLKFIQQSISVKAQLCVDSIEANTEIQSTSQFSLLEHNIYKIKSQLNEIYNSLNINDNQSIQSIKSSNESLKTEFMNEMNHMNQKKEESHELKQIQKLTQQHMAYENQLLSLFELFESFDAKIHKLLELFELLAVNNNSNKKYDDLLSALNTNLCQLDKNIKIRVNNLFSNVLQNMRYMIDNNGNNNNNNNTCDSTFDYNKMDSGIKSYIAKVDESNTNKIEPTWKELKQDINKHCDNNNNTFWDTQIQKKHQALNHKLSHQLSRQATQHPQSKQPIKSNSDNLLDQLLQMETRIQLLQINGCILATLIIAYVLWMFVW